MKKPAEAVASAGFDMERIMGIEPTCPAWEAGVLPLNYTRIFGKAAYALPPVIKFIKIRVLRQPK